MFIILIDHVNIRRSLIESSHEYLNSLDEELTSELKASYFNGNLDKKRLFDLDEELMNSIVKFYDNHVN